MLAPLLTRRRTVLALFFCAAKLNGVFMNTQVLE